MKDVNKMILMGRLGNDPVQRKTKNGLPVCSFSVATSRRGREEGQIQTQWHKVVAWGKQAEICTAHLKKGNSVYIEGTMKTRKYEGKDGVSRTAYEVHLDDFSFIRGALAKAKASERAPEPVLEKDAG